MEIHNDEYLMNLVKSGDLDSLAPLFEKYHVRLYNFFLRLIGDKDTSKDLCQNVFNRIIKYRHTFEARGSFKSWMYQIARNEYAEHFKKQKILFDKNYEVGQLEQVEDSTIETMDKQTKTETLNIALSKLSFEQREIIELARFQELKYKEIAELTGNTVGAVKVKIHRAINKLREIYFETA